MKRVLIILVVFALSSCVMRDAGKIERQILAEGKYDCETGEYYRAHSETVPNKYSSDPNATVLYEEYTCARYGKVPAGKEIKSFEDLKKIKSDNPEAISMIFVPCNHVKEPKHICRY
ncbi:MAG: hypothetical protein AAF569_04980 [Pseudomonadota bacterium]